MAEKFNLTDFLHKILFIQKKNKSSRNFFPKS
jgi:hypothetical protein